MSEKEKMLNGELYMPENDETLGAINTLSPNVTFAQSNIVRLWLE